MDNPFLELIKTLDQGLAHVPAADDADYILFHRNDSFCIWSNGVVSETFRDFLPRIFPYLRRITARLVQIKRIYETNEL
jgi:hypothetical protein